MLSPAFMYTITNINKAKAAKLGENFHQYMFFDPRKDSSYTFSILEAAEIIEKVTVMKDTSYFLLKGKMSINDKPLQVGELCNVPKNDSIIIAGTFKAIQIQL